ncbi:MAG: NTP transferase domain-containing protein [Oscillospiraceae bacterium]|nr:NTP transferase domain-containing protein [Oscillospiraceae bacterium]
MKAIILAAGKGKRLHSEQFSLPKVLRQANGRPLLGYVTDSISFIDKKDTIIVVGYKREQVIEQFPGYTFAVQDEQLGTGHAVNMARDILEGYRGPVLVCYGDMPLFTPDTYKNALLTHESAGADCTIITGVTDDKLAYGRIIRDEEGKFVTVVEDRDCTPEQKLIKELNIGIYVFNSEKLFEALGNLRNNNAQGEYYLTDAPELIRKNGGKIETYTINDGKQLLGVNTPEELEKCEAILKERA